MTKEKTNPNKGWPEKVNHAEGCITETYPNVLCDCGTYHANRMLEACAEALKSMSERAGDVEGLTKIINQYCIEQFGTSFCGLAEQSECEGFGADLELAEALSKHIKDCLEVG